MDDRTELVKKLDALADLLDAKSNAPVGTGEEGDIVREATRLIVKLEEKLAKRPVVPDNIEQAYLDGYGAATETAKSVQLRVSPSLDDAIALGISSVAGILEAQLTTFETQRAEGR